MYHFAGPGREDGLGSAVALLDDVDGDGHADIAVGAPFTELGPRLNWAGSVYVRSGATGTFLYRFDAEREGDWMGHSLANAGDVDADGRGDLIVGALKADPNITLNAGSAFVYSGRTGALLHRFDGRPLVKGHAIVDGAGDVDGDGHDDLIVGAPYSSPAGVFDAGSAFVYSGATGVELHRFDGSQVSQEFGASVSGAGDVDADGLADVIVSTPRESMGDEDQVGAAYVFSGATGSLIWRLRGAHEEQRFGESVASAGDLNGDGHADVFVGASGTASRGLERVGMAIAISGSDGHALFRIFGEDEYDSLGVAVAGGGDVDGDGVSDLVIGASGANARAGSVRVHSGATGDRIFSMEAGGDFRAAGAAVACGGDVDGDGRADVIGGAPHSDRFLPRGSEGAAVVLRFAPCLEADRNSVSAATGGRVTFALDFPKGENRRLYALRGSMTGTGPWEVGGGCVPLTPDKLTWRMVTDPPPVFQGLEGRLDAAGDAVATMDVPPGAFVPLTGTRLWFAAFTREPGPTVRLSSVAVPVDVVP